MGNNVRAALLACAGVVLSGCTTPDISKDFGPISNDGDVAAFVHLCRDRFSAVDHLVNRAGVREAAFPLIPGFPYVRNSRLMASYAEEAGSDKNIFQAWTLELRDNDTYAREAELHDLGMEAVARNRLEKNLRFCAVWLSNLELEQPDMLKQLVGASRQVPDERGWRDPIARLKWGAAAILAEQAREQAEIAADFGKPLSELTSSGAVTSWEVAPKADPDDVPGELDSFPHDEMGRAGLTPRKWAALAEKYAPHLAIEEGGPFDRLGTPHWTVNGPTFDASEPVVYYLPQYARAGKAILIQFNYFIFFSAHASLDNDQRDNGTLDGLIWRVTLDPSGKPVVYDVIHASGFDETWFPLPPLVPKRQHEPGAETPFIPQAEIPAGEFVVRIRSGSHNVRRLMAHGDLPPSKIQRYDLRAYEDLYQQPTDDEHAHNLYNAQGIIDGTERRGTMFYHALGIVHAGMLREWGKHPTSYAATAYFDDPFLIQSNFDLPDWPAAHRYQQ